MAEVSPLPQILNTARLLALPDTSPRAALQGAEQLLEPPPVQRRSNLQQHKVKASLVPMLVQNSLNLSESNCLPLSTISVLGTPNLHTMFSQKKFFTESKVIDASGLASIHLVKYSTATTLNLFPPCEGGRGATRSMPHLWSGHIGGISCISAESFAW
jgi:hypothetical protein